MVGRLSEVVRLWEYDMMLSEGELHIVVVDAENIAKFRSLKF